MRDSTVVVIIMSLIICCETLSKHGKQACQATACCCLTPGRMSRDGPRSFPLACECAACLPSAEVRWVGVQGMEGLCVLGGNGFRV